MFSIERMLDKHYPQLKKRPLVKKITLFTLRKLFHETYLNGIIEKHLDSKNFDFSANILQEFNFDYTFNKEQLNRIPPTGRVVIIANHPIGSLDALSILNTVGKVRSDVKIVVNSMLMQLKPLEDLFLPVNNMGGNTHKEDLLKIDKFLEQDEGALIIFPAGEVSRMTKKGVRDDTWNSGFLRIASKAQAPIVPIFITGRLSSSFYLLSKINKNLSSAFLVHESVKQKNQQAQIIIGETIPYVSYHLLSSQPLKTRVNLFKRHLYALNKEKKTLLQTEAPIAPAEDRIQLQKTIEQSPHLGSTPDGKEIYLYTYSKEQEIVLNEIGRLREVAFRAVGEGTGTARDIDNFDLYYTQLILWDKTDLEIVGAYRFCDTKSVIKEKGIELIYTHTLFDYDEGMNPYLEKGIELGRSFVQPKYWRKRSLDYLWFGIGAYLAKNPDIRYLFGPVTISNSIPSQAKDLLIYFYRLYFGSQENFARSKRPFQLTVQQKNEFAQYFSGDDYKKDLKQMKSMLSNFGSSIPTLYKQYTELCEPGGVIFLDFGVDPDFSDCIDGLVMVDISKIKPRKAERYIYSHQKQRPQATQ